MARGIKREHYCDNCQSHYRESSWPSCPMASRSVWCASRHKRVESPQPRRSRTLWPSWASRARRAMRSGTTWNCASIAWTSRPENGNGKPKILFKKNCVNIWNHHVDEQTQPAGKIKQKSHGQVLYKNMGVFFNSSLIDLYKENRVPEGVFWLFLLSRLGLRLGLFRGFCF